MLAVRRRIFTALIFRGHLRLGASLSTTVPFHSSQSKFLPQSCLKRRSNPMTQSRTEISFFSTSDSRSEVLAFEKACEDTLESLTDYLEQIIEESEALKNADVTYNGGVLTAALGGDFGTYVINRQSPNKQIWLSSPKSGPKRFDFNPEHKCWIYRHSGESLHQILQNEFSKIVENEVDFSACAFSKL